jgi:hypothetical protein
MLEVVSGRQLAAIGMSLICVLAVVLLLLQPLRYVPAQIDVNFPLCRFH